MPSKLQKNGCMAISWKLKKHLMPAGDNHFPRPEFSIWQ